MRAFYHKRFLRTCVWLGALCLCLGVSATPAPAQLAPVTVQVQVVRRNAKKPAPAESAHDYSNVAVWLTPLDASDAAALADRTPPPRQNLQLVQRNKSFEPHILVVQVHSTVEFPNQDPFFHNVFSLFDGKRFDLGLYEGGSSNSARFDRPGVSFLFCNIHPEMSAIVLVVETPYFGVSDRSGRVAIPNVADGRYTLHAWYERTAAEDLKTLDRAIAISESTRSLDPLQVLDTGDFKLTHKNKYGQDYVPTASPAYKRP